MNITTPEHWSPYPSPFKKFEPSSSKREICFSEHEHQEESLASFNDDVGLNINQIPVPSNFVADMWLPIAEDKHPCLSAPFQTITPLLPNYVAEFVSETFTFARLLQVTENNESLIQFLQQQGLLATSQVCPNCGEAMRIWHDKSKKGTSFFWICTRKPKKCRANPECKFSIKKDTFFHNSNIPMKQVLFVVWHFVQQLSIKQAKMYLEVTNQKTLIDLYMFCREVCTVWIVENWKKIGGPGTVVEIDESYFAGSPKYGKGKMRDSEKVWEKLGIWPWVFGLVQRGTLLCWLEQVPDRQRVTLVPIIDRAILSGTEIHSDKWPAYHDLEKHLQSENCSHYTVNHKKHYVDPLSGAHSQSIESNWRHCKVNLPDYGVTPKYLDYYLKTFMWRQYTKEYGHDPFLFFLECAKQVYPPFLTSYN